MDRTRSIRAGTLVAFLVSLASANARAAGVKAVFDLSPSETAPFPTDLLTRPAADQMTGLQVNLPKPAGCAAKPPLSECGDIDLVNQLDGFSLQPRLSIPFTGQIDVNTVCSSSAVCTRNVFLVRLGSVPEGDDGDHKVVGINQIVWDVATRTLLVESDEALEQYTRYALIVTNGIRDQSGDAVEASDAFADFRHDLNFGQTKDRALKEYRKSLLDALARAAEAGVPPADVVAASVFTTLSVTPVMERIRDAIKEGHPAPADFVLAKIGSDPVRATFPASAVTRMVFSRDRGAAPPPPQFIRTDAPLSLLTVANPGGPNPVGQLAFGKYVSPWYMTSDTSATFLTIPTRADLPRVGTKEIYFNLFLPSGKRPAAGWPIVIFGLGSGDNKNGPVPVSPPQPNPFEVASVLASHGLAVIAINSPGNGGGPLSTLELTLNGGCPSSVPSPCLAVLPAGGRSVDQNGDGRITPTEGNLQINGSLIYRRDVSRQFVVDILQLVRVIQVGMDVDGDGVVDVDPSRIYYLGLSLGAFAGAQLAALDNGIRASALNVIGAWPINQLRLAPGTRGDLNTVPSLINYLGTRNPSLLNKGGTDFDDNIPLRDVAPVVSTVPGAMALQVFWDRSEWFNMPGAPIGFAEKLRKKPLEGVVARPLILSIARGDKTVQNPSSSAFIRAGDLADVTTLFRNDLAFAACAPGSPCVRKDPHTFLVRTDEAPNLPYALQAQEQVARFFASDPQFEVIDPDGDAPFFEVPIQPEPGWRFGLPEDLAFIP